MKGILMSAASTNMPTPDGPGSVSGAPNLPAGFTDTFTSRYIDNGALRQHAVTGGEGPPLLLVHGWAGGKALQLRGLQLLAVTLIAGAFGVVMILLKLLVTH